jgi:hypothetical protein
LKLQVYIGITDSKSDVSPRKQVIMDIEEPCFGSCRVVTVTNFLRQEHWLKTCSKKKKKLNGTMRSNKREMPQEILPHPHRESVESLLRKNNKVKFWDTLIT